MLKGYENVKAMVDKSTRIVITTHAEPDADGIGSQVALSLALKTLGKEVTCVNEASLPRRYSYLAPQKTLHSYEQFRKKNSVAAMDPIDLFIVVDANSASRIGPRMGELLKQSKHVLFIDHHPCPPSIANLHCIDTTAAATGQVVGELIEYLKIDIDKEMALALYTAILIDTSSFRYPTVTHKTHRLIAKLLETGVRPPRAYNLIYGAKKIGHMQLLGKILADAQTNKNEEIAWISLTDDMITEYNANVEDTHHFVNHLLVLDQVKVGLYVPQERQTRQNQLALYGKN